MALIRRKVVVVDDYGGKTALVIVFSKGTFPKISPITMFDNSVADIEVDGRHIELALWDTGGNDIYDRVRPLAYPDSHVILICFDISTPDSLSNVQEKVRSKPLKASVLIFFFDYRSGLVRSTTSVRDSLLSL